MNTITKYLIAIGLFAGYSFSAFQFGAMHQREKDALATTTTVVKQVQEVRTIEQGLNADAWKIDAAYQKGLLEGRKNAQTLTDSLLNGSSGMYVPVRPTTPVSGNSAAVAKPAPETQCRLPGQTAADLTRLANEADDIVRQSNALVDYYERVLKAAGRPDLILERK